VTPARCSNCDRPLRPWLRGFCARCVTTPSQRERLARSVGAISNEGPIGRALDLIGIALLGVIALAVVVAVYAWLGFTVALVALVAVVVLGALGFFGGG
jgi:hypothetical protein